MRNAGLGEACSFFWHLSGAAPWFTAQSVPEIYVPGKFVYIFFGISVILGNYFALLFLLINCLRHGPYFENRAQCAPIVN